MKSLLASKRSKAILGFKVLAIGIDAISKSYQFFQQDDACLTKAIAINSLHN